jgi:hypothetical protein
VAKTWQSVLDQAREILQDENANAYRYTNQKLLNCLNRGVQELARLRPDAFWDLFLSDDFITPEVVLTDSNPEEGDGDEEEADAVEDGEIGLSANFNLPMMFHGPLVFFVAGSAELTDDEFAEDNRAMSLMTAFKGQVLTL